MPPTTLSRGLLSIDPKLLRALGDVMRFRIVTVVARHETLSAADLTRKLGAEPGSVYYHLLVLAQAGALEQEDSHAFLAHSEVRIARELGRSAAMTLSTATPRLCAGMVDETRRRIVLALIEAQRHGLEGMRTADLARAVGRRLETTYRSALWLAAVDAVAINSGSVATQARDGLVSTTPWFDHFYSTLEDGACHG